MTSTAVTQAWSATFPGATIGVLELSGVDNRRSCVRLDRRKRETEARLRARYQGLTRQELIALPVMAEYARYYKRFKKTYHVQLQLESIVFKGKKLPSISALVDANFVSEIETFVLTAGHDVAKLTGAVVIDVSQEGEPIMQMNGVRKDMHAGDMLMRDANGVSCSIIYGQDNRSFISAETSGVLYVAYAPAGVSEESVDVHLRNVEANIRLCCPEAVIEQRHLISA